MVPQIPRLFLIAYIPIKTPTFLTARREKNKIIFVEVLCCNRPFNAVILQGWVVRVVLVLLGLYLDNKIKVNKLLGFSSFGHSRKRKKRRRQTRNQKSLSKNKQKPCFYSKENNNNRIVSESKDQFI